MRAGVVEGLLQGGFLVVEHGEFGLEISGLVDLDFGGLGINLLVEVGDCHLGQRGGRNE